MSRAWVGRIVATVVLAGAVGALSRAPLEAGNADGAALRFTWRLRGEEAVTCRRPTQADLEDLPVHMRNPDACLGDLPPFQLRVEVDGELRVDRVVRPSGARGDRPLFVYDELRLEPGAHEIGVRFGLRERPADGFPGLALDTTVVLEAGRVLLVTRNSSGELEVRAPVR